MGAWGYKVGESDTFADVYDCFFERYNDGATPQVASKHVREEFDAYFSDYDDKFDAYFALALAQWETQSLEPSLLTKVEEFVSSGSELKRWKAKGSDVVEVKERSEALGKFLEKLSKPRSAKKRRKIRKRDVLERVLLNLPAPDGQKVLSITEIYVDGKYVHTLAVIMWGSGGGSIFHLTQPDLEFSANWLDSQNLEIRMPHGVEDAVRYSPTPNRAYYSGDSVTLHYKFV